VDAARGDYRCVATRIVARIFERLNLSAACDDEHCDQPSLRVPHPAVYSSTGPENSLEGQVVMQPASYSSVLIFLRGGGVSRAGYSDDA